MSLKFFKDEIALDATKYFIDGVEAAIVFDDSEDNVTQEGDSVNAEYLNNIQKLGLFVVAGTKTIESTNEIYDIYIEGQDGFSSFGTNLVMIPSAANTIADTVYVRFLGTSYQIKVYDEAGAKNTLAIGDLVPKPYIVKLDADAGEAILIDPDNYGSYAMRIKADGNWQKIGYATAAPTTGTHAVGDFYFNTTSGDTTFGWKCTVAGTPGTFEAVGNSVGGNLIKLVIATGTNSVTLSDAMSGIDSDKNYKIVGMTYEDTAAPATGTEISISITQTLIDWLGDGVDVNITNIDLTAVGGTTGAGRAAIDGKMVTAAGTGTSSTTETGILGEITLNSKCSVTVAITDADFSTNNLVVYLVETNQNLSADATTITVS